MSTLMLTVKQFWACTAQTYIQYNNDSNKQFNENINKKISAVKFKEIMIWMKWNEKNETIVNEFLIKTVFFTVIPIPNYLK